MSNCKYCGKEINGWKEGGHVTWCDKNPNVENTRNKLKVSSGAKRHSDETKKKISIGRKKFLDKHPDQVPYRLYHSSNKSWPEKTFEKYLTKYAISGWVYNYQFGRYSLDFAFPEWRLDVEIDGQTHNQTKVKNIDAERDIFLTKNNWTVIRFKACEIRENVYECINKVLEFLKYPKLIEIPQEFLTKKYEKARKEENNKKFKEFRIKEKEELFIFRRKLIENIISEYGNRYGIIQKIADAMHISHTAVRRICKKMNINVSNKRILTQEMKQAISIALKKTNAR